MKKFLKWTGITLLVVIIALAAAPFLFKDKIKAAVLKAVNENVNAKVSVDDVDLSLLKSFPQANVSLTKICIVNTAPFEGDTLFYSGELNLKMSVKELFKDSSETMNLESFATKNAIVNVHINKEGVANYDIALKTEETEDNSKSTPFNLNIQSYEVENLKLIYLDEGSDMKLVLNEFNHTGKGNFAAQKLDLDTKTNTKLSFDMGGTNYMKNVALNLDAVLGIDLDAMKFEFKENKALVNQLPLEFNGFLQMVEDGQLYNLTFKTPTSDFKNFLGLVPEVYAGNINQVKTTGEFAVSGKVNGKLTEKTIPKFNVQLQSNNASFQYPDLPKGVKNIVINTHIVNETGAMNDTFVNLDKLSFAIDQDVFNASATIKNFMQNALVNAKLNGTVNLANVTKAYPVKLEKPLTGILKANVTTKFDMNSVEKSQYQNIENSGTMSLTGFQYEGEEMAKPFKINETAITFNPNHISLNSFDAKTGDSDLKVSGTLDNFYGFLFKNQVLKGNFKLNATKFVVADFMAPTTKTSAETGKKTTEAVKIPSFLDCSLTANAATVVYDNLNLKNVSGNLVIKDEAVALSNLKMDVFDGSIALNGTVSTKGTTPKFNMNLGLNTVNIAQSFTALDMLKNIAPIAGVINGKLNSTINVSGDLTQDMTPDLKTLSGDLFGQLLATSINESNSKLLNSLSSNVKFIDVNKLNLNDVKAALTFKDGRVALKPVALKYQDVGITLDGTHGFDQSMAYNVTFDVPAKYLGTEVNSLLSKLSPSDQQKVQNIPVTANLTGSFTNPSIKTDVKSATTNLVNQLVAMQKDKLIDKGKDIVGGLLGGGKNTSQNTNATETDTTKTTTTTNQVKDQVKDGVKDALNGLFGKKKKKE
ncbi:AsmA-like C-terminal region-containing protein [Flavobacterium sp.]|uniref:AsmA-like C-terminal region-containing protein n=1 Tax=Flavobacterium sp. TaxID=239 RepID=UPI0035270625